ncbi:MAG TPA: hypothetical protein VJU78_18705 [Chitinophagaceae bacterium]|nr:hypothetical protein [Chitinophagaceae bacterium]
MLSGNTAGAMFHLAFFNAESYSQPGWNKALDLLGKRDLYFL